MAVTAIWGEFIYHDVSHTPQMAGFLGQRLKCCGVEFESFHPECYPIKVEINFLFGLKFNYSFFLKGETVNIFSSIILVEWYVRLPTIS
jgi:hypothetical protein